MAAEILKALIALNIAGGAAILLLLAAGPLLRRAFGARLAYAAWLIAPLAAASSLMPAREAAGPFAAVAPVAPLAERAVASLADGTSVALALWALGAVGLFAAALWRQSRTLALLGRLQPEPGGYLRAKSPRIGPAVVGVFRPAIVLPSDFERRYDAFEQAVVLTHEETHLAARDPLVNGLIETLRCLFWINPLVHLAVRRIRLDQELACDAAVMARYPKTRRLYAETMLKTQLAEAPLPFGCHWLTGPRLKQRILGLTRRPPGPWRRRAGVAAIAALGLCCAYAGWATTPGAAAPAVASAPLGMLRLPLPPPDGAGRELRTSQAYRVQLPGGETGAVKFDCRWAEGGVRRCAVWRQPAT